MELDFPKENRFAIIIDEAHSGQSGRNSAQMNLALSGLASDDEMDNEDKINAMMEGRKLLNNASYFAFTATPKNKINTAGNAGGHYHRTSLSTDFALGDNLLMKMLNHHGGFLTDGKLAALYKGTQLRPL